MSEEQTSDIFAFKRISILKNIMREIGLRLDARIGTPPQAISHEDRIGTSTKYIRAMEKGYGSDISGCLDRYPKICELVANPYDFQDNL